ncbi:hypothetical protein [Chromobacterium paludis]|nr:hypothetical protein [Chromobacterium paludis]
MAIAAVAPAAREALMAAVAVQMAVVAALPNTPEMVAQDMAALVVSAG